MICVCCNETTQDTVYFDDFFGYPLQYCKHCGHLQLKKTPDKEAIEKYYGIDYSVLRKSYIDAAYLNLLKRRAGAQFRYIAGRLDIINKKVCDIGCGYGLLLEELRKSSANAIGLEFDELAIDYCLSNSLSVAKITSESHIADIPNFDIITLSHVLEHFIDLEKTVETIKQKTDYLFIEVPAYDRTMVEQFFFQEGHVNFFTRESLRSLLLKTGFEIIDITCCGPSLNFFWSNRLKYPRKVCQFVLKDYFLNQYSSIRDNGIWIRALVASNRN